MAVVADLGRRESAVFWQAAIPSGRRLYAPCHGCRLFLKKQRRTSDVAPVGIDESTLHAHRHSQPPCFDTVAQAAGHHRLCGGLRRWRGCSRGRQSRP